MFTCRSFKSSTNFWSRDNLPLPVWESSQFALVDARYYYNFEPDVFFQNLFGVNLSSHKYFYEGGNFMANARGDCLVVNRKKAYPGGVSDTAAIPDDVFKSLYGCKNLIRLKHLKGIGHADEVVKFMSDDVVFTDTPEYVAQLEKAGFQVVLLPEADLNYETYINSLLVNDTIFVPVFGESNDQKAIDAYKKLGLKVVPINTRALATGGQGGIHCITMNYPPSPIKNITRLLNAQVVQ
ncbi:agmatine deiminase family protein [bacterium]|nr:agmatine deiminase family protein [bacterium]